jgi:hypothetical protein
VDVDPRFLATVERAFERFDRDLADAGPVLGREVRAWIRGLRGPEAPWVYLTDVRAFPTLYLPWFLEEAADGAADAAFQEDLIASSLAGYLHIRIIDEVMDRPDAAEVRLLPALGVLHLAFEAPYRAIFPAGDPFFATFDRLWRQSAEDTLHDGLIRDIGLAEYDAVASRKTRGALIPMEAVLHRRGRHDLRAPWTRFVSVYGRWHQMEDDVSDWRDDLDHGRPTYFLDEARRRVPGGAAPGTWILGGGLDWAFTLLDGWWRDVLDAARPLGSRGIDAYLAARWAVHARQREGILARLAAVRTMFGAGRRPGEPAP